MVESAILLAGGMSRRMGRDKARLPVEGEPMAARVYRLLSEAFPEVVVVTNRPEEFPVPGARMVGDRHPGRGPLEGLASGLEAIQGASALLVACDMPFLTRDLLSFLASQEADAEVIVPVSPRGPEPLLAVYSRRVLPVARELLERGERRMEGLMKAVPTWEIPPDQLLPHDPERRAFWNLNYPEEYRAALDALEND